MKLKRMVDYFLVSLENQQLSSNTIKAYRQDLNQFVTIIGNKEIDDIDFLDIQEYYMALRGLKATSIKRKRTAVIRCLNNCYQKRLCSNKVADLFDPIKAKKNTKPKEIFSTKEIEQMFSYFDKREKDYYNRRKQYYYSQLYYCAVRNKLIISILLYTGCRANELVSILKSKLATDLTTLEIHTKGDKINMLPVHPELKKALLEYRDKIEGCSTNIKKLLTNSEYLFPSIENEEDHITTRTLYDIMNILSKVLGRHVHAHLFRHTFASYCIASNMDISTVSALLTHSNPAITLSIYTHEVSALNKREQLNKLHFKEASVE